MTARSVRRAAERKARKEARKAAHAVELDRPMLPASRLTPDSPEIEEASVSITPARLEANRANAQLSTGPRSTEGKAASSRNALKTALTGRTVLLPGDDAERYERHLAYYDKLYRPIGDQETALVQSLADTMWRLDRIPGLEEALYVKGCNDFAAQVSELDPREQLTMLRMHTYLAYERQFRNLNIQEMRLFRHREKLIAEILKLQQERAQKEKDNFTATAQRDSQAPAEYGFEFSTSGVEAYLEDVDPAQPCLNERTGRVGRTIPAAAGF